METPKDIDAGSFHRGTIWAFSQVSKTADPTQGESRMLKITDAIALEDREIKERFVRAMGPHGQNSDRDATAVELRFDVTRSSLPTIVKERLIALGGKHVTPDGVLVVVSREFRSQARNRASARGMLARLVAKAATAPATRVTTKATSVERERRLASRTPD
jgi:ribosome-associated protein